MNFIRARIQADESGRASRLAAMEQAAANPNAPADLQGKIDALKAEIDKAPDELSHFNRWEQPLRNRFGQIDGSSMKPVNKTQSEVLSNWMAIQRMAKLGRVAMTHFASLPTKSLGSALLGHSVRRAVRLAVPRSDPGRRGQRQAPSARQYPGRARKSPRPHDGDV